MACPCKTQPPGAADSALASPISLRTKWGGEEWEPKRARMETVCGTCHAQPFVKRVFLATDLGVYQFNEFFKVLAKMRER